MTYGGTTNTRGLTLLSNYITVWGGGEIQHTSTPTWASERIVSERCFSWKQGWKYQLRGKRERREERVRRRQEFWCIKWEKYPLYLPVVGVNPGWVLPGDVGGNSGSRILHYGLNPIATDSRGHSWQGARSLFTLKTNRQAFQFQMTERLIKITFWQC